MKLDRNENGDGTGKYALVNLRRLDLTDYQQRAAFDHLRDVGVLDLGEVGAADEFFVIRLKDVNARAALLAYATAIHPSDREFAAEVRELADRAGSRSPFCKDPD